MKMKSYSVLFQKQVLLLLTTFLLAGELFQPTLAHQEINVCNPIDPTAGMLCQLQITTYGDDYHCFQDGSADETAGLCQCDDVVAPCCLT
jgi:hypothetical protein